MTWRVLIHLALLPLCVWALVQVLGVSSEKAARGVALWLVAAVILHDLVLVPFYAGLDRVARRALRGPAVNYVRVPAGLSLLMLLVFWGTFAGSAAIYLARRRSAARRRRAR